MTPFERPKKLGVKEFYTDEEVADLTKRVRQGEVVEGFNHEICLSEIELS